MSTTTPPLNLNAVPNEPTLSDLLDLLKKEIFLDLNCHHIGTVQSFNSANQTVTATINYTKTLFELNQTTGLYQAVQVNYSPVLSCPVVILSGGPAHLTMPIAKGDECLLLFNDRDIDNWFANSTTTQPNASLRLHAFTDAIALVGLKSTRNVISGYDTTRALISNGTTSVGINPSNNKLTLTNGTSLGTLLKNLCTQLKSLCDLFDTTFAANMVAVTASPGNPSPINPALATQLQTLGTNIQTISTNIGTLIE